MLSYLRHLRQKLLEDNRFNKYLLYVFIEVFIVILGILIAIQVDNWNEDRKEEDMYRSYLVRLKTDFEEIHFQLDQAETKSNELVSLARYLTDFLNGDLNSLDTLKLAVCIEKTAGMNQYDLSIPTYSELSSTGRLAIIENDSLKNMLNRWHQYGKWREGIHSELDPLIFKYRDLTRNILATEDKLFITNSWWRPYPGHPIWDNFNMETEGSKITIGLYENPDILGVLNDILIFRTVSQTLMKNERGWWVETIELIDSEINRLSI
jgi:hypothetical protein